MTCILFFSANFDWIFDWSKVFVLYWKTMPGVNFFCFYMVYRGK